jgi:hypothetical protein
MPMTGAGSPVSEKARFVHQGHPSAHPAPGGFGQQLLAVFRGQTPWRLVMSHSRFNPKQLRFLELYFQGYSIQNAVKLAGYKGATPQSRCNTGRAILDKFSNCPEALFLQVGSRERKVAQLLADITFNNKSVKQQLKALKILSNCIGG